MVGVLWREGGEGDFRVAREDDEGGQKSPREGIHGKARGGWPGRSELRVGGVMDVPWSVICIECPFLRALV